jgi:hypothetical protein
LGSALVLQGILSPALFPSLQRIQKQLIEGVLTREEGIKEVQDTFVLWLKAEESKEKVPAQLLGKDTIAAEDSYVIAKSEPIRSNGSQTNAHGHHVEASTETVETKLATPKTPKLSLMLGLWICSKCRCFQPGRCAAQL